MRIDKKYSAISLLLLLVGFGAIAAVTGESIVASLVLALAVFFFFFILVLLVTVL